VLITGSGRRLGKGLAIEFASSGWDVVINNNKSEESANSLVKQIKSTGRNSLCIKADVTNFDEVNFLFSQTAKEIGIPDVLVNNAGIFPLKSNIYDTSIDVWNKTINTNLSSQFYCSKVFAEYAKDNARIVNFGSLGAFEIWNERIPYNVSKAGVIQLTKALARELAPKITVNCVCPGSVLIPEDPATIDSPLIPASKIPTGRHANVKDIFDAVYFFSTATNYITGQYLLVDGGYHLIR